MIPILCIYPREIKIYVHTCTQILIAALFKPAKLETIPMSLNWELNKQTGVHPDNELLLSNDKLKSLIQWTDVKCIMLRERSQTLGATQFMISFIELSHKGKTISGY